MAAGDVLILGCGYTGRRVLGRLLGRGVRVTATTRDPLRREELRAMGASAIPPDEVRAHLRPGMRVLHSIPPRGPAELVELLAGFAARVVYLSSTAVYGGATVVDAATPVDWGSERARARLEAEARIAAGPWSWLVLRPAAIYGPGRGVHESFGHGPRGAGDGWVSRIHVDDLAAHVEAGLFSELSGAYPVADEEPCTAREIAEFCARLLGLPLPAEGTGRVTGNRRVDGSAVRRALGIALAYPSYRVGIPAAIAARGE